MITLITAVPGSGKTLYAITLIDEALKDNRPVYTNINGLVKDKFFAPNMIFDAPDDWRDCPEGSLIIYDEAQQPHLYPSNAQRGKVEDERLTALETHRHGGYDLIFITQAPTFVHHHIRKLVGLHVHLYRAKGVSGAVRYEWSHTCDSPNDRKEQERADSIVWKFPSKYFPYYTSAVMHTHKFRLPLKMTLFFVCIAIAIFFIATKFFSNGGLSVINAGNEKASESEKGLPSLAASSSNLIPPIASPWRLAGYVTVSDTSSIGRPLALAVSPLGSRFIDFNDCSYSDDKLTVSCVLDGSPVDFYTGTLPPKQDKSYNPFN